MTKKIYAVGMSTTPMIRDFVDLVRENDAKASDHADVYGRISRVIDNSENLRNQRIRDTISDKGVKALFLRNEGIDPREYFGIQSYQGEVVYVGTPESVQEFKDKTSEWLLSVDDGKRFRELTSSLKSMEDFQQFVFADTVDRNYIDPSLILTGIAHLKESEKTGKKPVMVKLLELWDYEVKTVHMQKDVLDDVFDEIHKIGGDIDFNASGLSHLL